MQVAGTRVADTTDSGISKNKYSCSSLLGRSFKILAYTALEVVKTAATFAVGIGGGLYIPKALAATRVKSPQLSKFKSYLHRFPFPGFQFVNKGRESCPLHCEELLKEQDCLTTIEQTKRLVPAYANSNILITIRCKNSEEATLDININPIRYNNYKRAILHVEKMFLLALHNFPRNADEFIALSKEVNAILNNENINDSRFRNIHLQSTPLHSRQEAAFDHVQPAKIEQEMVTFANTFIKYINEGKDAIEIASFLHYEFFRIMPFFDQTNSLGRIFLNAALVRFGEYNPVVFQNHARCESMTYLALKSGSHKVFDNYLRNEVIPWTEKALKFFNPLKIYDTPLLPDAALYMIPGNETLLKRFRENDPKMFKEYESSLQYIQNNLFTKSFDFLGNTETLLLELKKLQNALVSTNPSLQLPAKYRTTEAYTNFSDEIYIHHTAPAKIEQALALFAKDFKALIEKNEPATTIAAYAHRKVVEIWPFDGDNFLLARVFMYLCLARFRGIKPFQITSMDSYIKLTQEAISTQDDAQFATHLEALLS